MICGWCSEDDPVMVTGRLCDACETRVHDAMEAVAEHEWCRRCGGPNVAWSAPSPLWNYVMRGNDINGEALHGDLVCMTCFVVLGAEAGLSASGWRLTLHPEPEGLINETPSGRVWDAESFLWVEREGVEG